ncbi:hypothetical protein Ade02nite_15140 [Paractinoplanes deccanensis]|uniref:Baseplate protein J-like domain-containing protein n=1 Tax=Paractinoplanes deccanensis TaxID=113561 RepID=A0ABQ3XYQ1_9ACTN|nr:hypothetical protein [Actinoplanes deccanensis]GID72873.1 hypothetical protein Ade02nite_15140 [Actinoplanes deccanensis]
MTTTPLELLGTGAGLSVIDPGTILTRLWYFDGKFLRAEGFRTDQAYVRSLAALSHQATGSGVVHGYDVSPAAGDKLRITGGLALAPSGRVAYLPRQAEVSIADLIARSSGAADPATPPAAGVADFGRCAPEEAAGPDVTVAGRPLYLLTVAGVEALCGEEERFGQLCVDACATETDRSTVVEGVRFRVRELALTLPSSSTVPFDLRHLRSRVASAYFAAERTAVPSRVSGSGLATPVWCAGAEGIGGDEVPLAVLDRAAGVTALIDGWTARRELQEATPRRYWQWRMAMRPWDVFLAQVLQFQCQLADLGRAGASTDRETLRAAAEALGRVEADPEGALAAVRKRLVAALDAAPTAAGTGSLLLDGGLVELPPAGYLPIDLTRPVGDQVRALLGDGVDLRFCVARPDHVPEMLQEAQHLDRISLTRGLDEPDRKEAVDVLVPDGVIGTAAPATTAFTGTGRILENERGEDDEQSALTLSVVARDRSGPGWSWTAAAYGELPRRVSVQDFAAASAAAFSGRGDGDPFAGVSVRPNADQDRIRRTSAFARRLVSEGRAAAARRAAMRGAAPGRPPADRPLAEGEFRPVMMWLDGYTEAPVDTLPIDKTTRFGARFSLYSRASTRAAVFIDVRIGGSLRVLDSVVLADRKVVRTETSGVAQILQADSEKPRLEEVLLPMVWTFHRQTRALSVAVGDPEAAVVVELQEGGVPRHVSGRMLVPVRGAVPTTRTYATLEMREQGGVLDPGSSGRALAESVIAVIGAELAVPGRDPSFPQYATERLLGGLTTSGPEEVTATTDWVFFTRRRDRRCAGDVVETPVVTRTYRLFHRTLSDRSATAAGLPGLAADDDGDFEPVATVQFTAGQVTMTSSAADLRAGWLSGADRGNEIRLCGVGDFADSDGEAIALGRLSTVRSVLADLADSSNAQAQYLPDIPAQYHQPGLHGAMFTAGVRRRPVVRVCVTIYRLLPDAYKRVLVALRQLKDSVPMSEVLSRANAQPDVFFVDLADEVVVNPDSIPGGWDQVRIVDNVVGLPSGTGPEDEKLLRERAAKVGRAVHMPDNPGATMPAQTGDCGAILVVAAEPAVN